MAAGGLADVRAGSSHCETCHVVTSWFTTVYALNLFDVADRNDPSLADLHVHRENGSSAYVWPLFDRLDDLRPVLKLER
jgi:hypothetical protein